MSGGELIYSKVELEENQKKIEDFIRNNKDIPTKVAEELIRLVNLTGIYGVCIERADYLLSGDDGYESFLNRWKEDLAEIESIDKFVYQIENGEIDESDKD